VFLQLPQNKCLLLWGARGLLTFSTPAMASPGEGDIVFINPTEKLLIIGLGVLHIDVF